MVMPGRDLSPPALHEMLETGVTVAAAVPTVWLALLPTSTRTASGSRRSSAWLIGGSSCPRAVIERFQDTTACACCMPGA